MGTSQCYNAPSVKNVPYICFLLVLFVCICVYLIFMSDFGQDPSSKSDP